MFINPPPSLSWKVLVISALLFASPVLLFQGTIFVIAAWGGMTQALLWLWLIGTAVGFALSGSACAWRVTTDIDPSNRADWGRESGFLIACVNVLMGGFVVAGYLVWYANWWIPSLPVQSPFCNSVRCIAGSLPTQGIARFGFAVGLPVEICYLVAANAGFVLLSVLGGMLAAHLRGRLDKSSTLQSSTPAGLI